MALAWGCGSAQSQQSEPPQYPSLQLPLASSTSSEPSPRRLPAQARTGDLPDPEASSARQQWRYELVYDRGSILVQAVHAICLRRPLASARRIGRFAFELWLGVELVDRIRFDFPLLAAEEPVSAGATRDRPPSFAAGAHVTTSILVPANPRAARAQILDRATGQSVPVEWPPAPVPAPGANAPCDQPAPPVTRAAEP